MGENHNEILKQIRSSTAERRLAITSIANDQKLKRDIITHITKNSGSEDDGLMVFHDSIVAFVQKVFTNKEFQLKSTMRAYIYGIARLQWLTKLQKENRNPLHSSKELNQEDIDNHDIESIVIDKERSEKIKHILLQLKVNCKQVLMYWAGGYKMSEIADILGYKTEGSVRKKKYECFKELVKWLGNHPEEKEDLKL